MKHILLRLWVDLKGFWNERSAFTFCLFLLFATILWYGHALNTVRERTLKISISYTGIADNICFDKQLPTEFRFTVRDQGKRLQKYREQSFEPIEINLHQQLTANEGRVHITSDQVKSKIADQLQGTAKIQNIRPELIETEYFAQAKKIVPIKINGTINASQQYFFTKNPIAIPSQITIYGKQQVLDTIQAVLTEHIAIVEAKDSVVTTVGLLPIAGVRYSIDKVNINASAEQYTEKTFTINITAKDVPEGEVLRLFPATTEVTLRIPLTKYNDVSDNDITIVCQYPLEDMRTLPLQLIYNNTSIIQARLLPQEVEYIIEKL